MGQKMSAIRQGETAAGPRLASSNLTISSRLFFRGKTRGEQVAHPASLTLIRVVAAGARVAGV